MSQTAVEPTAAFGPLTGLAHTRSGRRYRRLYRVHRRQVQWLLSVDPGLRRHVAAALRQLAEAGPVGRLDGDAVACATSVLDDLARLGDVELQREVEGLREELALARGHTISEVLAV